MRHDAGPIHAQPTLIRHPSANLADPWFPLPRPRKPHKPSHFQVLGSLRKKAPGAAPLEFPAATPLRQDASPS
jgi:hypothetical protein